MSNEINIIGIVEEVSVKPGFSEKTNKPWKRAVIKAGGKSFSTFDEGIAKSILDGNLRAGIPVEINFVSDGQYNTIKSIFPSTQKHLETKFIPQLMPGEKATPNRVEPDWNGIARGKIRSLLMQSVITNRGLVKLTKQDIEILNDNVEYCMTGFNSQVEDGKKGTDGVIKDETI